MGHQPPVRLLLLAALTIASTHDAHASDTALAFSHVRTAEPRLRTLIDDAIATSPTVRALVERITASDVVVFVACEPNPNARTAGRMNFMTASGGVRYVLIRLKPWHRVTAIAMLAHELQHAAEVAAIPSIVDAESLAREYARMGFRKHSVHGLAFDTKEALDVGRRVVDEVRARARVADAE
jgi:hypothetical protein